jgi:hypothetical protein
LTSKEVWFWPEILTEVDEECDEEEYEEHEEMEVNYVAAFHVINYYKIS